MFSLDALTPRLVRLNIHEKLVAIKIDIVKQFDSFILIKRQLEKLLLRDSVDVFTVPG